MRYLELSHEAPTVALEDVELESWLLLELDELEPGSVDVALLDAPQDRSVRPAKLKRPLAGLELHGAGV